MAGRQAWPLPPTVTPAARLTLTYPGLFGLEGLERNTVFRLDFRLLLLGANAILGQELY